LRAHAIGRAAAVIERDADVIAAELARSLAPAAQTWAHDVALVFVGRDRESTTGDPVFTRYRAERAVSTLGPPLARALASLAPPSSLGPSQLTPAARALVRAAAEANAVFNPDALSLPLARAAVATLVELLFGLSVAPLRTTRTPGLVRELNAFAAALE
jgi:hypothetical protein